jgi:hypothetical protein
LDVDPSEATEQRDGLCPVCGGARFRPVFQVPFPEFRALGDRGFPLGTVLDVPSWTIVECEQCTAHFPDPYPSADEIDDYYASQAEPSEWEMKNYVEVRDKERQAWRDQPSD